MSFEENIAFDEGYDQGEKDMKSWLLEQIKKEQKYLQENEARTDYYVGYDDAFDWVLSLLEEKDGI